MARLTVRNLDEDLMRRLRIRAAEHGRSAEEEHRRILEAALRPHEPGFWARAASLRAATRGRGGPDSADLIRKERDNRAAGVRST
jgi:plasmid stability protein